MDRKAGRTNIWILKLLLWTLPSHVLGKNSHLRFEKGHLSLLT